MAEDNIMALDNNAEADDMGLGDLASMFGSLDDEIAKMDEVVLTQNLEGFAGCFPDWDLHPPVK